MISMAFVFVAMCAAGFALGAEAIIRHFMRSRDNRRIVQQRLKDLL